ncbi:MAG: hypothetical protein ACJAYJ_004771 [Saprospiraceae bacterium]|jgi:hypothetical protein
MRREKIIRFSSFKKTVRIAYGNAGGVLEGEKWFCKNRFSPSNSLC